MKAHIFDLDGTLLDSMGVWIQIDRDFLDSRGIAFPEDDVYEKYVETVTPLNPHESAAHAIEYFGLNDTIENVMNEWNERAMSAYKNRIPLKPGAAEYLQHLRSQNAKMAIATSSPAVLCMPALHKHGITDLFNAICLSEEVGCGKSRPDVFLLAAQKLNAAPSDCIVYEDNLIAINTAKSIGMTVCGVCDLYSKNMWDEIEKAADFVIRDFNEGSVHLWDLKI